jgi:hypothetical protein
MNRRLALLALAVGLMKGQQARAQASYRNLDAGLPVRIEDATVTDRYDLRLRTERSGGPFSTRWRAIATTCRRS